MKKKYTRPETIEDWQKLLNDYNSALDSYKTCQNDIIEKGKILKDFFEIKEKIKNMQNIKKKL